MVNLNPKQLFQSNSQQREEWAAMVASPTLQRAFAYSLATMVANGLAPEQLAGVNSFIYTALNLSEDAPPAKPLPYKPLKSFDMPAPTLTKTEPTK